MRVFAPHKSSAEIFCIITEGVMQPDFQGSGVLLSVSQFADECGYNRTTVATRIAAAKVQPAGKRGSWPVYQLRDLLRAIYLCTESGELDPSKMRPFERRAHNQAEILATTLAEKRGELVKAIDVEQRQAQLFKIVVEFLETLPDVIERDCGAPPLMIARLERRLDDVRAELYARLTEETPQDNAAIPAGVSA